MHIHDERCFVIHAQHSIMVPMVVVFLLKSTWPPVLSGHSFLGGLFGSTSTPYGMLPRLWTLIVTMNGNQRPGNLILVPPWLVPARNNDKHRLPQQRWSP